jgi:FkbM family methyltransferase
MYEGQVTRGQILALLPEFECIGIFEGGHCLLLRNRALSLQSSRQRLFFDIGAHDGLWTLANSASDVRIVSVEGSPITFERLSRNCELAPHVVCVNCVVSDEIRDEIDFFHCEIDVLSTTQKSWLTAEESRFFGIPFKEMKCKSTTLDELIRVYGVPDLIKLDVEGAEFECLSSLTQMVSLLCFEWASETRDSTLKCLYHLSRLGFSKFALQYGDDYTFRPKEYTTIDNVRIALAEAVPKQDWGMIWCR